MNENSPNWQHSNTPTLATLEKNCNTATVEETDNTATLHHWRKVATAALRRP